MKHRRAPSAASLALAGLALSGCYATTPHRPEVQATIARRTCMVAVDDVFTRAAFVPQQTPEGFTAFFAPRMGVHEARRTWASVGVGVLVTESSEGPGGCRVVLEALSMNEGTCDTSGTDVGCATPSPIAGPTVMACPASITTCPMTSAPSPQNDAMVDDLARRLRDRLGPSAIVSGLHAT